MFGVVFGVKCQVSERHTLDCNILKFADCNEILSYKGNSMQVSALPDIICSVLLLVELSTTGRDITTEPYFANSQIAKVSL